MFNLRDVINKFDRLMVAVSFAEAGEPGRALEVMNRKPRKKERKRTRPRTEQRNEGRPVLRV